MKQFFAVLILAGFVYAQASLPLASVGNGDTSLAQTPKSIASPGNLLAQLPPAPGGRASLIGGTVRSLDPIRDRIVMQVFGGGSRAVLFDERTQVYVNGRLASPRDLGVGQHVYAETVLEKADVFARSIHITTYDAPEQSSGQVVNYDAGKRELTLRDAFFPEPVKLRIESDTPVLRGEHSVQASELRPGTLVAVHFVISAGQEPTVRDVSILAQPGNDFIFPGQVTFLDLHTRTLVLSDPRDNKSYEVYCDPAVVAVPEDLRQGANVTVTANFDGSRYAATAIRLNPTPSK